MLLDSGKISTLTDLSHCSPATVVRLLHLSIGFEKQVYHSYFETIIITRFTAKDDNPKTI